MSFSAPVSNLHAPRPGLFSCLQQPQQQGDSHPQPSGAAWPASADCPNPAAFRPPTLIVITFPASSFPARLQLSVTSYVCLNHGTSVSLNPPECALTALCFASIRCILDEGTVGGHFSATFCFVLFWGCCFFFRLRERIVRSEKEIRQHGSSTESDTLQPVDIFFPGRSAWK